MAKSLKIAQNISRTPTFLTRKISYVGETLGPWHCGMASYQIQTLKISACWSGHREQYKIPEPQQVSLNQRT